MITVASSDGVDVAVHRFGGAGQTLLFSHATGFHGWCYAPLARALADRFDSVALDYRGHGQTPQPAGWDGAYLDWRACGDDAVAVLATLPQPAVGFGHSMGGATLVMAAVRQPAAFERLVLFEPIAFPPSEQADPELFPLVAGARRRRRTFESVDAAFQNYAAKPPLGWFDPEVLSLYVDHGFRPAADGGVELCCEPSFEAATFAGSTTNGVWDLLPEVDVPVLVLAGRVEPDQPSRIAADVAGRLPNGSYLELDHMTHFGPFTHIDEIADLIRSFARD